MSVGEWLNSVIRPSDDEGERSPRSADHDDNPEFGPRRPSRQPDREPSRDKDWPDRDRADRSGRGAPYRDENDRDDADRVRLKRGGDIDRETADAREEAMRNAALAEEELRGAARAREEIREAVRMREEARIREEARQAARAREEAALAREEAERDAARAQEELREAARISEEAARNAARAQDELREAARSRDGIHEAARARVDREPARSGEETGYTARIDKELRETARTREELGEVHARLDKLSDRLERLARSDFAPRRPPVGPRPAPQAPDASSGPLSGAPEQPRRAAPDTLAGEPASIERPPDRNRPSPDRRNASIEEAVAQIAARQRALDEQATEVPAKSAAPANIAPLAPEPPASPIPDVVVAPRPHRPEIQSAETAPVRLEGPAHQTSFENPPVDAPPAAADGPKVAAPPVEAALPPVQVPTAPVIDLSGLEEQLRNITAQIETLRPTNDLEKAIEAVRGDLTEIGRQLTEALPRRAVESLEIEIKALAERIDHSRQCGVDASMLSGLERGLAEIREALRGLTTAESLVGVDEAVKTLSQKVDLVAAKEDPAALQQLETAIGALRGIVSHVASNDTLTKVAEDVRSLAAKVDGLANSTASGYALSVLENRIDTLATALNASTDAGHAVPRELEKLLAGLLDKLERVQLTQTDHTALEHLEDRIAQLVKRFDASDARLGHLEAIERGLADLLVHIEEIRRASDKGEGFAAVAAAAPPAAVDEIKRTVEEIRQSERRTQDTLEAVQGTVEQVVDRLAVIETDMRREPVSRPAPPPVLPPIAPAPAAAPLQPAVSEPALPASANVAPIVPSGPPVAPTRLVAEPATPRSARAPIDPNLPPDHPLEPGSAAGRPPTPASAADRIAASEAALGSAKPPVIPDPAGKSNFIAAARRAAQTAASTPSNRPAPQETGGAAGKGKLLERLRKLIVAGAAVLIVVGCLRIASRLFEDGGSAPPPNVQTEKATPPSVLPEATPANPPVPEAAPAPANNAPPATPTAPAGPKSGAAPDAGDGRKAALQDGPGQPLSIAAMPATEEKPTISAPPMPMWSPTDVTGSLPRPAARQPAAPAVPAMANPMGEKLPATIGGPTLRAAALSGDAAAAYEIAMRYSEGHGVAQSATEAAHWLDRAAKQGLAPAQFRLGGLYEKGIGVKKDLAAARDLYLAAAQKGNGKAMHNLAVLYAEGINGPPDYRNAGHWFRMAADRGVTDSQYNLGILYARGIGVEQNLAESYKWFVLAADQGDKEAAKKRDEIEAKLDKQSLAAVRLAVQNWAPQAQPEDAIAVKAPAGGWDPPSGGHAARPKSRTSAAKPDPKIY